MEGTNNTDINNNRHIHVLPFQCLCLVVLAVCCVVQVEFMQIND
jgi:hypothetical protein